MSVTVILSRVSGGAIDGRLNSVRVRQRLFHSFHTALLKHRAALLEATQADDGCTSAEAQAVFASALIELRSHYDGLDFEKHLDLEYSLARSKSNEHRRTPIALVYIVPNTLNLLYNVVSAMSAALEAGSCVVTEVCLIDAFLHPYKLRGPADETIEADFSYTFHQLENTVQRTPSLLRQIITESLDQDAFGVVSSRAPREFLTRCVVVDQKPGSKNNFAAERVLLSPEYRNIALVDRTGDTKLAAREIIASRLMFGGASSYAVDLVLVNEFVEGEFREALSRELAEVKSTRLLAEDQPQLKRHMNLGDDTEAALFNRQVKSGAVKFVRGDSSEGILQVYDRSCPVVCRKLLGSRVIVFTTVTSLDDTIDFLNAEGQQTTPIGALYIFAKGREGKYLSQYIDSRATYVNHIPAQLSGKITLVLANVVCSPRDAKRLKVNKPVGPMAPKDYSTNLRTRYTREMFELPSPEIVPGPRSHCVSRLLEKAGSFDQVAQKPLKSTGQPASGAWGFFEQGIILGAIVYILPVVGAMAFGVGYVGWTGYSTWRMFR